MDFLKQEHPQRQHSGNEGGRYYDGEIETPEELCDYDITIWRQLGTRFGMQGRQIDCVDANSYMLELVRKNEIDSYNRNGEVINFTAMRNNINRII